MIFIILILFSLSIVFIRPLPSSLQCCGLDAPESIVQCVNATINHGDQWMGSTVWDSSQGSPNITFMMYASREIWGYAAHTLLVLSTYCSLRGYALRVVGPETGDDYYPEDVRWNKIRTASRALDPVTGWARDTNVLVTIDADLAILDFGTCAYALCIVHFVR